MLSDDVISGFTKTVQHSIKNIFRNIKEVFFRLGISIVRHKRSKMTLLCHCHDNSYAAGPVLIKTKIPRFYPKPRIINSQQSKWGELDNMGRLCVPS